jgi:hypothetical protein
MMLLTMVTIYAGGDCIEKRCAILVMTVGRGCPFYVAICWFYYESLIALQIRERVIIKRILKE